jgi:hypothetical protein
MMVILIILIAVRVNYFMKVDLIKIEVFISIAIIVTIVKPFAHIQHFNP